MRSKYKFICTIRSTSKYIYRQYAYITFNNDNSRSSGSGTNKCYDFLANFAKKHVFMVASSISSKQWRHRPTWMFLTMKFAGCAHFMDSRAWAVYLPILIADAFIRSIWTQWWWWWWLQFPNLARRFLQSQPGKRCNHKCTENVAICPCHEGLTAMSPGFLHIPWKYIRI